MSTGRARSHRCICAVLLLACAAGCDKARHASGHGGAPDAGMPEPSASIAEPTALAPAKLVIDAASPASAGAFLHGWADIEGDFRWSLGPVSRVEFELRPAPVAYAMTLNAATFEGKAPQTVAVKLNGRALGSVTPKIAMETITLAVPLHTLVVGRNTLELTYAWTAKPSDLGKGTDARPLAIKVKQVGFRPLPDRARLDVNDIGVDAKLGKGWSDVEHDGARAWIWSDGTASTVTFNLAPARGAYDLRVTGSAALEPLAVEAVIAGVSLGRAAVTLTPDTVVLAIPEGKLTDGANTIELRYSQTTQPTPTEPRRLALSLQRLELTPTTADDAAVK